MSIFDLETDDQIKEFMQGEGKNIRKPYVELSRRIPNFSSKQLCNRWNYKLNPRLNPSTTNTTIAFSNVPILRPR
ncbi:14536_t:CDS:2 [Funneliformis caledonium]|uniref:14536_t:CDS:1 n=1 Tax=Funneliformis caledonium TaxID=1117310 RepID=A0A9N9DUH9_9GLOM|nr:14536_t:CDS:2 [Funneliformis caledonium]